ncbi:complex I assembly factor TIMMDC1, mitochondrial [Latimeria chalumnae]|uniref:Complex I assembly factor TIMMDC1, mitochondrial n=1 Tax=Latimeria chalumnae TaxID=7897 RepID=H3AKG9_LATCH|nr:PREDICTED: complex I assembly factor TIMMDC1, mitochondrial [Latimeria chalumnae]XP_006001997.1 PREDICTED: complex I assembly factor TIMMDC1, mitochondrial [Latimeria chalumnae]XP_006001998.1 PREDICTED: complex I assembly factor TIMMDC1, mitochondrial [Latimeria chalumnae]XP_006001999.1 PREDICTED: complex I assembly factor TIMMDC1, mitochondrial [Latimeria chalumnae]|eukprot:XP_006001996.1 PREDICTED: complex I assembly factor TIMMDC1, mitochondrial [Latimeria chalumnae]
MDPDDTQANRFRRVGVDHSSGPFLSRILKGLIPLSHVAAAEGPVSNALAQGEDSLPLYIGRPELPESGWDRIVELFDRDEMQPYPEEISNILKSTIMAAVVGLVYGGIPAALYSKERYIAQSKAEVYRHRVEAVRLAHDAAIRGFIRYGWRWSWRVAAFVTLFNTISTGLSVYRDKHTISHFTAAGAITCGLFRMNLGLGGLVAGTAIGAVLGVPVGALMMAMQKAAGETIREKKRRERKELYELKLEEWSTRLNIMEGFISELDDKAETKSVETDLEKIEEILSLQRNPVPPSASTKQ